MKEEIKDFDPNDIGLKNNRFIGLPFDEKTARVVLLPVPWDVTVSYCAGTASGPENILAASSQLDLADIHIPDAWQLGIYMRPPDPYWKQRSKELRPFADNYIQFLEAGGDVAGDANMQSTLAAINRSCKELKSWVKAKTKQLMADGKLVGIVGGEHSVPLGYIETLTEKYRDISILQIDAHLDLREAYEGFAYSHASIFHHVLKLKNIARLTQVGIRDYCEAELAVVKSDPRIKVFLDMGIRQAQFKGMAFSQICDEIVQTLTDQVYISFDIDGLDPSLCPNTGTPVPGGLHFQEAIFLLEKVMESGRKIIGFDLCEVAGSGHEWDGNVGARILYKLSNLMTLAMSNEQ